MPLTFDATPAGPDATSYATIARLDDAFLLRPASAFWILLTNAQKEAFAMQATQRLEVEEYSGMPKSQTQRLEFPRSGLFDSNGFFVDDLTVPDQVVFAMAEVIAVYAAAGATDQRLATGLEPFSGITVGPIDIQLRDAADQPAIDPLPVVAARWLRTFLMRPSGSARVMRG